MDVLGDKSVSLFQECDILFSKSMSEGQSALSASLSSLSSDSASSAMSSWGSESMSEEAISERAAVWGNGVAQIVLKNSSERSCSYNSCGSLMDSNSVDSAMVTIASPVHSQRLENAMPKLAFMVCDASSLDGPILYASPGFFSMTGYSPEEVVGEKCWFLQGEETDAKEVGRLQAALRTGRVYSGTVLNYKKDGTPFWDLLTLSPLPDDEGNVIRYFGMHKEVGSPQTSATESTNGRRSQPIARHDSRSARRAEAKAKASDRLSRCFTDEDASSATSSLSSSSGSSSDSGHAWTRQQSKRGGGESLPVFALPARKTAKDEDDADENDADAESVGSNRFPLLETASRSASVDFDRESELRSEHRKQRYSLTIPRSCAAEMYRRDSQLFALTGDGYERLRKFSSENVSPVAERDLHASTGKKSFKFGREAGPALRTARSLDSSNPLVWFLAAARCMESDVDVPKSCGNGDDERSPEKAGIGMIGCGKSLEGKKGSGACRVLGRLRICRNLDQKQWVIQPVQKHHIPGSFDRSSPRIPTTARSVSTPRSNGRASRVESPEDHRHGSSFQISPFRLSVSEGAKAVQIQLTPTRHSIADLRHTELNRRRQFIIVHG